MISPRDHDELVESIEACGRVEDLLVPLRRVCELIGFDAFIMGVRTPMMNKPPVFVTLSGLPRDWVQLYDEKRLLNHDPIIQRARGSVRPFGWDELEWDGTDEARFIRAQMEARGIGHGFTLSCRGPVLQSGLINFARRQPLQGTPRQRRALFDAGRLAGMHLFDRAVELIGPLIELPRTFRLTAKELEFLRLSALGLPLKKINDTMKIQQSTATYFTNRIVAKIGVRRIREAVFQAQMNGLIDLISFPETVLDYTQWFDESAMQAPAARARRGG